MGDDGEAMRRAVAFCQVIEIQKGAKTHKVSSRQIAGMFKAVVDAYQETEEFEQVARLNCEAEHVDGSMNASEKEAKLVWLKESSSDNTCRDHHAQDHTASFLAWGVPHDAAHGLHHIHL